MKQVDLCETAFRRMECLGLLTNCRVVCLYSHSSHSHSHSHTTIVIFYGGNNGRYVNCELKAVVDDMMMMMMMQEEHEKMKSTWREKESDSDSNSSTTKRFVFCVLYVSVGIPSILRVLPVKELLLLS